MDQWGGYAEDTRGSGIHRRGFRWGKQTQLMRMQHGATLIGMSLEAYIERCENGEKWCGGCHAWHLLAAFGPSKKAPDGLQGHCRAAARASAAKAYAKRKAQSA